MRLDKRMVDEMFIKVPEGTVDMRDDRINKTWQHHVDSFLLAKFPVSQDLYQAISGGNPSTFKGKGLPVETVSWMDAIGFCNRLSDKMGLKPCYIIQQRSQEVSFDPDSDGFRLPTEAEWQYACQAGSKEIRYGDLDEIAWYKDNSKGKPRELGTKKPNDWGLYDMLGNVWEWCNDIYDESVYGSYRVFRGGGWSDQERSVMATTRRRSHPSSFKIDDLGFRISKNLIKE